MNMAVTIPSSAFTPLRAAAAGAAMLVIGLAGCSVLPPQPSKPGSASATVYQENIGISGRLSVQYEQGDRPQSLHGSFIWAQKPEAIDLELFSPLGQTVATLHVGRDLATLTQAGRPPQTAPDIDELAAQSLGWPLPVSGMRHWLQGRGTDASGMSFSALPGQDQAGFSTRDGWRVVYANWEIDPGTGKNRPKRIDMTRETQQAGKVVIRIAIDGWKTP